MLGVFTKPEMLLGQSLDSRAHWMDRLMRNDFGPLNHRYFALRLPTAEERTSGISSMQARALEASYFATNEPWIGLTSGSDGVSAEPKERLGTPQLLINLSSMLTQRFKAGYVSH